MIQTGNQFRLTLKALTAGASSAKCGWRTLMATVRRRRLSRGAMDFPHSTRALRIDDFVRTQSGAICQGQSSADYRRSKRSGTNPHKKAIFLACLFFLAISPFKPSCAQSLPQTLGERLGFPRDAKLVIIHADDVGVTHSVNSATIQALKTGLVNSASIMVPCPWFPEIADYAKSHSSIDFGLHLTLTSERVYYRWGPVASRDLVPSLLDSYGYLLKDWAPSTRISPQQAQIELRAQIERAYAMGVRPTHLDSHQYRLYQNGEQLFRVALGLAHEYKLPLFVTRDWFAESPYLESSLGPGDVIIDHTITISPNVPAEKWDAFYVDSLKNLQPGVTEFVIHLAFADSEMKAATRERDTWGAAWRQRDFNFFTSPTFRKLLQDQQIRLITWRQIAQAAHELPTP